MQVDGKLALDIHLYDLRQRLRDDPPGTVVSFTVKRGEKTQTIKVTLRDLI
jgi:S1-C subfamily serine protease